ncbi:cardiolipin synthase [Alteribacter keqinensis]|uniref:Cardiolipin synthase n=1 Tax=Alteribacter keqinensis TaxID=2483800 RepID=A0A3M7TSW8_9BACI|nr:cardiolipin synthase [Alteribacter keqinensis]RNA67852.1 cardiolipin synthase [Alteribacter keqinensis]
MAILNILLIIILVLLAVILLFIIDFNIARYIHHKNIPPYQEPPFRKSDVEFFARGDKLFDHLFGEIEQAEQHIHMLFYIFREDDISKKMLEKLKSKAKAGVEVRLMVDFMGIRVSRKGRKALEQAGVQLTITNKPKLPFLFYSANQRNHRKITVIDGRIGYIGGYNVGDEYLGRDPEFGPWRDYHLAVKGEGVIDLQKQFLIDWKSGSSEDLVHEDRFYPPQHEGKKQIQIFPSDGAHVEELALTLISKAKRSLIIGSPYFVPGKKVKDALIQAAKRGVDIRVLMPKNPDHPLVIHAAYPYFRPLIEAGVDIHLYFQGFYHSKAIIVDDNICDIGTANFDKRSFYLNNEVNCLIYNESWIEQVMEQVKEDLNRSDRVTIEQLNKRSLLKRSKEALASAIGPLM